MGDKYADFYDVTDDESVASDFDEEFSLDEDEEELDSADPETTDSGEDEEEEEQGSSETRTKQREEQKERKAQQERRFEEESEKIPRTLFVGNLPLSVTRKSLARLFSVYGSVESVRLRGAIPEAGKGRGLKKKAVIQGHFHEQQRRIFGYVVFKTEGSCAAARREMNGYQLAGRHIRVDSAASGGANFQPRHCVFVGGLPYVADEEAVRKHFISCGEITNIRLVRDACGAPKGIGFVEFVDEAASVTALKKNGSDMEGRSIRVQRWSKKQQEKGSKPRGNQQSKMKGKGGNPRENQQSKMKGKGGNPRGNQGRGKSIRIPTNLRKEERAEYVKQILRKRRHQRNLKRRADGEKVKEARKTTYVDEEGRKERKKTRARREGDFDGKVKKQSKESNEKKTEVREKGKVKDSKHVGAHARVKVSALKRKNDFKGKEVKQKKKKKL